MNLLFRDFPQWTPPPMDEDEFWAVAGRPADEHPGADPEWWAAEVAADLARRPPADIVAFDEHLWAALRRSYRWDLWGAAYLIRGGCSDDGFDYFRGWLIARGRVVFEAALADPDSLAGLCTGEEDPRVPNFECGGMLSVAYRTYRERTGEEIPDPPNAVDAPPELGDDWDFDDPAEMRRRLPKLWAKFGED